MEQIREAAPLTWGILGTGRVAQKAFIPVLQGLPQAKLLAIASQDEGRARLYAEKHCIPRAYGSYQALIDDPAITCIYNALPNHLHKEWTIRAARAGKHVLCEKPLGCTLAELDEMESAARAAGAHLMEALMYQFHPRFGQVKKLLAEGTIGGVRHIQASFCFTMRDLENHRSRPEQGGGALLDVGGYVVHAACSLMGAWPDAVCGVGQFAVGGIDETVSGLLEFPGGRTAHVLCSFGMGEYQRVTVAGTRGVLDIPQAFTAWHDDPAPVILYFDHEGETQTSEPADPYAIMTDQFIQSVFQGTPAPYPLADSRAILRVVLALGEAAKTGERQSLVW
jgi:xylose dehydrogenase (NAD/NADP)